MRIAVGSLKQESNTFAPADSDLEFFRADTFVAGPDVLEFGGRTRVELSGFLNVLRARRAAAVPLIAAHACSGGPLRRDAFDALAGDLLARLRAALPVDAVLLSLHGALVLSDHPDGDGLILRAVRDLVGPEVPVAASLDLHGHITPEMVDAADLLVGFKKYPHTDMYETGERTAALLLARLDGRVRPAMAMAKRHMLVSPVGTTTEIPPFQDLMNRTEALEAARQILAGSLFPVQPWLDVPDLGFAAVVVSDGDREAARRVAEDLCEEAWRRRSDFAPNLVSVDEAVRRALDAAEGPIVVGDSGDAPSGGSAGDSSAVLSALLAHGADRAGKTTLLTLVDAPAVQAAVAAGVGAELTVPLGHTVSRGHGRPVTVTGTVRALGDGRYTMTGPAMTGATVHMGRTAVFEVGRIHVVLMERPTIEWDPALYRSMGEEPSRAGVVFVKSPSHFRVSYRPFAAEVIVAESPGANCCNMTKLTFRHVTRPLYPIDEDGSE